MQSDKERIRLVNRVLWWTGLFLWLVVALVTAVYPENAKIPARVVLSSLVSAYEAYVVIGVAIALLFLGRKVPDEEEEVGNEKSDVGEDWG